jgi:tRNA threonylcarbamoyl adenosine modification protein YeaZ
MTKLILDTSQDLAIVALSNGSTLIDSCVYPHQNKLSALLTLSIQSLLKKHHLSPHQLSSIAVGIGPGSYTGTRVAVTIAKTLSLALDIPLISFCSLLAFIPEKHTGLFYYLMESKQSSPFYLKANAQNDRYEDIVCGHLKNLLCENEKNPFFASNVSLFYKSHPALQILNIQQGSTNLSRLCQHLHKTSQDNTYFPKDLGNLELIYLHNMDISPVAIEAIPSLQNTKI